MNSVSSIMFLRLSSQIPSHHSVIKLIRKRIGNRRNQCCHCTFLIKREGVIWFYSTCSIIIAIESLYNHLRNFGQYTCNDFEQYVKSDEEPSRHEREGNTIKF